MTLQDLRNFLIESLRDLKVPCTARQQLGLRGPCNAAGAERIAIDGALHR